EVPVAFDEREIKRMTAAGVRERFGEAHHRVFFFGGEAEKPIEFVSFRLGLAAPLKELPLLAETETGAAAETSIRLYGAKDWRGGALGRRAPLAARDRVPAPALLEARPSTLYVPAGGRARRDENDNPILERG